MSKTKIVCTIGPASETEQIITGLCKVGMNVARLNFLTIPTKTIKKELILSKRSALNLKCPLIFTLLRSELSIFLPKKN